MNDKINLAAKLALLEKPYEPGIVGFLNDYKLQAVKVKGPFVWHKHDETDDFFLVLSGRPDDPSAGLRHRARARRDLRRPSTAPMLKKRARFSSSSRGTTSTLATPAAQ
jgi:hypothetical protein